MHCMPAISKANNANAKLCALCSVLCALCSVLCIKLATPCWLLTELTAAPCRPQGPGPVVPVGPGLLTTHWLCMRVRGVGIRTPTGAKTEEQEGEEGEYRGGAIESRRAATEAAIGHCRSWSLARGVGLGARLSRVLPASSPPRPSARVRTPPTPCIMNKHCGM
jgi:hypothetical protein